MQVRPVAVLAATLTAIVAMTTGCGAGQQAQTSDSAASMDGVNGRAGDMLLRDAVFVFQPPVAGDTVYEPGDDAILQFTVVNNGPDVDRLVDIRSDIAAATSIAGDTTIPGRHVLTAGYTESLADIEMPDTTEVSVRLLDLHVPLRAGITYPVTFLFQHAGPLTAHLPVGTTEVPARRP